MRITDAFLGEHGVFYAQLDHFERALERDDLECLRRRAELLATALEPHALLENELLFDAIQASAGSMALLDVMREEHREIEAALADIQATQDPERARTRLLDMIRDARDHFEKEERMAFPLAEEILGEDEILRLGSLWATRRGVRIAPPGTRIETASS